MTVIDNGYVGPPIDPERKHISELVETLEAAHHLHRYINWPNLRRLAAKHGIPISPRWPLKIDVG